MEVITTAIPGVVILQPKIFNDSRGYFFESYSKRVFDELVRPVYFVQDNESCSTRGVMRGLHFQKPPYAQSKMVRCVKGAVLDVAVDIRKGSPTYGQHVAVELTQDNHRQLFIPRGFAHGFAVLSDIAVFQYKCDNYYHPEAEGGISIADASLGIDWHIDAENAVLSEKDTRHPLLKDFDSPFDYNTDYYNS
ncbi:MAG: dTDP-4-dehydrorhamnose 3,5-epimerase [Paramuribaculum sp.]|nr:dTDP-4-dehydrorhamnose 3,5-epimerase [Paramuribaculum sp.]